MEKQVLQNARTQVLELWEEAIGTIRSVDEEGLSFDGFRVITPGLQTSVLQGLVGKRIGIIRVEDGYKVREEVREW